ncbi:hypothetical protein SNEBB_006322 [Seison nebaliae]|nr:hypothetical protein SNEBB_006322 [Seison nebaliae]
MTRFSSSISNAFVFGEAIQRLDLIGDINRIANNEQRNNDKIIVNDVNQSISLNETRLDEFEQETTRRYKSSGKSRKTDNSGKDFTQLINELKKSATDVRRSLFENPTNDGNFQKIDDERLKLMEMLLDTMKNLIVKQNIDNLKEKLEESSRDKQEYLAAIEQSKSRKTTILELTNEINECRLSLEREIAERNDLIAHLKDQVQELKCKSDMEYKYVKNTCDNSIQQTQRQCQMSERQLETEISDLKADIEKEEKVHVEVKSFLETLVRRTGDDAENWNRRYDQDILDKQQEIDMRKTIRAKNLEDYRQMKDKFGECTTVVDKYRSEKDKERRQREEEEQRLHAAIKLQSWWRGMMVRCALGAFSKKKKKKKGKKSKKK